MDNLFMIYFTCFLSNVTAITPMNDIPIFYYEKNMHINIKKHGLKIKATLKIKKNLFILTCLLRM